VSLPYALGSPRRCRLRNSPNLIDALRAVENLRLKITEYSAVHRAGYEG
jgi:hypothetical protein